MTKLQFEFKVLPSPRDEKSNIIVITSITTECGETFILSEDIQQISLHTELIKTKCYNKIKNSLKKRYQSRKIWILLTEDLKETYIDEGGNIQFKDQFLEKFVENELSTNAKDDNLTKLLETFVEATQINTKSKKNYNNIGEKFMLEKFTSKHSNVKQWMDTFENECIRFEIFEDEMKIEVLRLFLDKSCLDWHSATLTKFTINSSWDEWKNRFLNTFADKGWSSVTFALNFKYREGSLIDYALKKERLLLDVNKDMDMYTLIALIVTGLPNFVMNKLNRDELNNTTYLFNEIRKHESLINVRNFAKKKEENFEYKKMYEKKKPCRTCENLNKGIRYHPEDSCWFKTKKSDRENIYKPKAVSNNSIIEVDLNNEQKNE